MPRRWSGVIAREGVQTGDGRVIAEGALYWDASQFPLPLRWDREDDGMHLGAVVVGTIDHVERRDGGVIWASGEIDDQGDNGAEAVRLMEAGILRGVSIDPDDWEVVVIDTTTTEADVEEAEAELVALLAAAGDPDPGPGGVVLYEDEAGAVIERLTRARLRAATLVDTPAFADALITLDADTGPEALVAAVTASRDLPLAARDRPWDGDAARQRLRGPEDDPDWERVARGHFWRDDDADPETLVAYRLPFADVIDGTVTAVPQGIFAVASVLSGGRDGVNLPDEDQERVRSAVAGYYERMADEFDDPSITPPWDDTDTDGDGEVSARTAASTAPCQCGGTCEHCAPSLVAAGTGQPPAEWFTDPHLDRLTPLTVQDGRVWGHIAGWGTCHTGSPAGGCVTAPRSAANYAYFRTGVVETSGGDVPVGQVTIGGGHADLNLSHRGAVEHYDDCAAAVADVAAGEDEHGIWVAGALRPGVSDEQVAALRAASPSGDWRNVGGNLELVAVHAVNVPGFPVARVASGRPCALVAAGAMAPRPPVHRPDTLRLSEDDARRLLREAGREFAAELDRRASVPHRRRLAAIGREVERERREKALARLRGA